MPPAATLLPPSIPLKHYLPPVYEPGALNPPLPPFYNGSDDQPESGSQINPTPLWRWRCSAWCWRTTCPKIFKLQSLTQPLRAPRLCPDPPLIAKNVRLSSIFAAHVVCEFGNVIIGQTRKKVFKITNASLLSKLNWVFDNWWLSGSGFSIEPEEVAKMAKGSTLNFTIKFFACMQVEVGQRPCILPFKNPSSSPINIVLTACTCLPEVKSQL